MAENREKKQKNLSPNISNLLKQISGVQQENFLKSLLPDLVTNFGDIEEPEARFHAVIESLEALQPRDAHELMICIQLVALHRKGMNYLHHLSNSDKHANLAIKLLRLHSEKLDGLMKYRRKGQQIVQVVHVNDGAKAIIGNVQGGGV